MEFSIGNLYVYNLKNEIHYSLLPNLEWNPKDNLWTLKMTEPHYSKVEKATHCIYMGKTNSVSVGAFLMEDKIVAIHFKSLNED